MKHMGREESPVEGKNQLQRTDYNTDRQNVKNSKGQQQPVSMIPDVKSSRH